MYVYNALTVGNHSLAEIAHFFHLKVYNTKKHQWNGMTKHDAKYKQIHSTIFRIKDGIKYYMMNAAINGGGQNGKGGSILKLKSMQLGARGCKVLH